MKHNHKTGSVYLHDIPLDRAWDILIQALEIAGLWKPLEV